LKHAVNHNKIQNVLLGLGYPFDEFSIDHFVQHVQHYRNRPILCVPYPFSPGISGAWIYGNQLDFIIYRSNTHRIHQNHVILHEIAHMLLKHPLHPIKDILSPELLEDLQMPMGHLRALEVNRAKDVVEQEAEYFVALVQKQVVRVERMAELTAGGSSISALHPYVAGLPYEQHWDHSE
jgi:hypothetical protein